MTVDRAALREAALAALGPGPHSQRQLEQVDAAVPLVQRAMRAWPIRDPLGWAAEIVLLDLARANTALARLIREHATTPTFGSFFEVYRSLDTRRPPAATCEACDGSGWVEAPPLVANVAGQPHEYTQMRPCPGCAEGAARERSAIWRERHR